MPTPRRWNGSGGSTPGLRFVAGRPHDRRLPAAGHHDSGKARPREVLRPRSMVEVGVDLGRDFVRTALPDVVPQHLAVAVRRHVVEDVAAVAVRDEETPEALR